MIWRKKCEPSAMALLKATNFLTSWISLAAFYSLLPTFPNPHTPSLLQSYCVSFLIQLVPTTFFALIIKLLSLIVIHILFCDSAVKTQKPHVCFGSCFLLGSPNEERLEGWRKKGNGPFFLLAIPVCVT